MKNKKVKQIIISVILEHFKSDSVSAGSFSYTEKGVTKNKDCYINWYDNPSVSANDQQECMVFHGVASIKAS